MDAGRTIRGWAWSWELNRFGVLGINRRNLKYLAEWNPRGKYKLVDDKVLTKRLCEEHRIAVPQTYAVIDRFGDLKRLPEAIRGREQFVVKPASGAGGRGVLVVTESHGRWFVRPNGSRLSFAELRYHVSAMLSGLYSLGGQPDRAIIEELVVPHPVFEGLTVGGTPDIRIVVYRGVPALAMLRLPTKASRGRANLHQGAVAAGIDLDTGRTLGGVCRNRAVAAHPDTGLAVGGLAIPQWEQVLATATAVSEAVGMGYIGVDIMLDQAKGAIVLEANARPGLAVQIANRRGLVRVLRDIDAMLSAQAMPSVAPAVLIEPTPRFPENGRRARGAS